MTLLCLVVLTVWFGLSLLGQLPGNQAGRLRRHDPASLIPNWSFFAPRPVTFDYHLLYRDELWDLTITDWTEIPLVEPRAWWCFLWNPRRRAKKALFDSCSMLLRLRSTLSEHEAGALALHRSVPYLMLLNHVSGLPHPHARGTQFALLRTFGPESAPAPVVVFSSQFHAVEEAHGDPAAVPGPAAG